jgi:hypothetical protein
VYLGCALAALQLRRRGIQSGGTPFRLPGGAVAPVLAVAVILALLSSITLREWAVLALVVGHVYAETAFDRVTHCNRHVGSTV